MTGGQLQSLTGSDQEWTAEVTVSGAGTLYVILPEATVMDALNNSNLEGFAAIEYDLIAPSVVLTTPMSVVRVRSYNKMLMNGRM